MYNSQEVVLRIKKVLKTKGISIGTLQAECGLGKNAITQSASSQEGMKSKNLYAIAEYLNVSVDYLLGRTDEICIEEVPEPDKNIGEKLKKLRENAGLSADELGRVIGKDRATVYRYEKGDIRKIPIDILESLAHAVGVSLSDIISIGDDVMPLSDKEKQLILAYRQQTDIQKSVDRLLGISETSEKF